MENCIEITSEKQGFHLGLKELWRYRDLIVLFTKKTFMLTYKQTVLGPLWLLITPLLSSGIYSIVFGTIAGIRTDGIPQLLFFLCNNCLWGLFSSCLNNNANVFRANAGIFGKVYFPRLTVPVSNVLVRLMIFGIQFAIIVCFVVFYAAKQMIQPRWSAWLAIPLILLWVSILGMSIGILASSLTTKYRDLAILVSFGVQLWMYITPVVYPLSELGPGVFRSLVSLNPVTAPMELFRWILLGSGTLTLQSLVGSFVFLAAAVLGGITVFHRVERTFMDSV